MIFCRSFLSLAFASTQKNMSRHLKDVHGLQNIAGPYKCKLCGDYFATARCLYVPFSSRTALQAAVLDEHREWHRVPVSERSPTRTCEMCKLVYPSSKAVSHFHFKLARSSGLR